MNEQQIGSLTERIDRLEKKNRRLGRWTCGLMSAIFVMLLIGAAPIYEDKDEGNFKTIHAQRIALHDSNEKERLILELNQGEPTLTMFNHDGLRQVYLGINENWGDAAYLSLSSQLHDGKTSKQAVLVAKDTDSQLLLYDLHPKQESAARRRHLRIGTGNDQQKPYMEIRESSTGRKTEVTRDMLKLDPSETGRRFFLDTTPEKAMITGADLKHSNAKSNNP